MLRPVPARWFEVLVAHDDAAPALAALAAGGAIELEAQPAEAMLVPLAELRPLLERYQELARLYQPYWPAPRPRRTTAPASAREVLLRALGRLSMWHASAASLVRVLQAREHELTELDTWRTFLGHFRERPLDCELLVRDGPVLSRRLYVFAAPVDLAPPAPALSLRVPLREESGLLVIAPHAAMETFHRQATALKGRYLELPRWLHARAEENLAALERRRQRAQHGVERLRRVLARFGESCVLPEALADIERLRWFTEHVPRLPASEHFAWVTGWTGAPETALRAAIERAALRALIRFPHPPAGLTPPLLLSNPWWVRPFEIFARAFGVPGRAEVDPSMLLAFIAPLLFGYMFADVGQGFVLVLVGLALARRYPVTRLLVAGGAAAMVFGLLFGSAFSREDVLPALWLHPLDDPLTVLGVPLAAGAALLALGLLLNAIEAHWRGLLARWALTDAGVLVFYLGALAGILHAPLFWLAAVGLAWYLLGHYALERRPAAVVVAVGGLLEQVFQLAVNTLSFARVGAFALAHAGLSSAIVVLAGAAGHPLAAFVILLAGNVVMIALEALVVSVQTTRLVLFEFFIRFLHGEGRPFRPLPQPPSPS